MERLCLGFLSFSRQLELLWLNRILLKWLRLFALHMFKLGLFLLEHRFGHKLIIIVHNSDHQLIIDILRHPVVDLNNLITNQYIPHCILWPQSHTRGLFFLLYRSCLAAITSGHHNFSNGKWVTLFFLFYIIIFIEWLQL